MLFAPLRSISNDKVNIMRIAGITIPDNKRIEYGLMVIYGIGHARSLSILKQAGIDPSSHPKTLTVEAENKIRAVIDSLKVEGDLKRLVSGNIKRLKDIKSYRGTRHAKRLPVRGQRTKTNSRTIRGNVRKTMGSGRRKVEKT